MYEKSNNMRLTFPRSLSDSWWSWPQLSTSPCRLVLWVWLRFLIQLPVVAGPTQATRAGHPSPSEERQVTCEREQSAVAALPWVKAKKENYGRSNFCLLFTIHPFSFKPKFSAFLCWWGQGKESQFACRDEWERLTLPQTRLGDVLGVSCLLS